MYVLVPFSPSGGFSMPAVYLSSQDPSRLEGLVSASRTGCLSPRWCSSISLRTLARHACICMSSRRTRGPVALPVGLTGPTEWDDQRTDGDRRETESAPSLLGVGSTADNENDNCTTPTTSASRSFRPQEFIPPFGGPSSSMRAGHLFVFGSTYDRRVAVSRYIKQPASQ